MPREVEIGSEVIDQFPVWESNGFLKKSGLTDDDFLTTVFQEGAIVGTPVTVTEIGTSGEYKISVTFAGEGLYEVQVYIDHNRDTWHGQYMSVEELTHDLAETARDSATRALGLLHDNGIVDNQVYDAQGQLTSARLRVFDSSANIPATPGGSESTGLLYEYEIVAEYSGLNVLSMYKMEQVL